MILQIDYSLSFNVSSTHLRADSNHARLSLRSVFPPTPTDLLPWRSTLILRRPLIAFVGQHHFDLPHFFQTEFTRLGQMSHEREGRTS